MEWANGFSARYYYTVVDAASWRDLRRYKLTGGSISKTTDSLMESADLNLKDIPTENEIWIRVWLDARQKGDGAHEALFTGLLSIPGVEWDGTRHSYNAECYSVLKPAADILLPRGWFAAEGMSGAELAAGLLGVGAAPVVYDDNSPLLESSIVSESGENNLSMAQKIVSAIGWRIRISGRGEIRICPKGLEPDVNLDSLNNDIIEVEMSDQRDWFNCPNVFRATYQDITAVARDDDPDSPYSTVARGREIWKEDKTCNLNTNESIEQYVARRLKEEQSPARICNYSRRFVPDLYPGDAIRLHYPAQNIDGDFRIKSQQIDLGYAARTAEEVEILIAMHEGTVRDRLLVDNTGDYIVTDDGYAIEIA